ncbi:hypothetical protein PTKU46_52320 [Paraburkholderia terrae]
MTSVETAPAVRSPSRPTVVMRGAAALSEADSDADSDAEPVAPGFTALPRNARRRARAGDRAIQYPPPVSRLSNRRYASGRSPLPVCEAPTLDNAGAVAFFKRAMGNSFRR